MKKNIANAFTAQFAKTKAEAVCQIQELAIDICSFLFIKIKEASECGKFRLTIDILEQTQFSNEETHKIFRDSNFEEKRKVIINGIYFWLKAYGYSVKGRPVRNGFGYYIEVAWGDN